ncbi:hypothetical protein Patl1_32356 [Pistacia atlantica]|uniref:Uncharacterized protein n=1 Tax=Pistacia atlantica TaxID=434234 RepID=A0ACC1APX4_9ROSI|nr:hypothetical protein Patl1_32356 [Pistacia atlantica]
MAGNIYDKNKKIVCYDHGGLEEDAEDYGGLSLMKLNLGPRKKLVIFGLGGLLCHRVCHKQRSSVPIYRSPDAAYGSYMVYKRPYCTDFMKFCLERFEVGIWSSAREWYMSNALDCIMAGLRSKLLFAWVSINYTLSKMNVRILGSAPWRRKDKPIFLKELDKIWENKYSNLPSRVGQYLSSNTLLIDTDAYKALLNPPHTSVFPTEYKASDVDDDALGPKGELRLYLDGLVDADDVPSYIKEHPFGQPAITALHPHWDYYSKVVTHIKKATLQF